MAKIAEFITQVRNFGTSVALKNALIGFTYWAIGAKSMRIRYDNDS